MNQTNKHIMILGCQRAGKTTLANMLCQKSNYSIFSVDALVYAFEHTMPEIGINKRTKINGKSKIFAPFIATYFENFIKNYPNQKFIIECCQLLPKDVVQQQIFKNFQIVCLGYPNATPEEIFSNIRNSDKSLSFSYTTSMSDEALNCTIPYWIQYSKYLQKEANQLSIPFFETNTNRKDILNQISSNLLNDIER